MHKNAKVQNPNQYLVWLLIYGATAVSELCQPAKTFLMKLGVFNLQNSITRGYLHD